MFPIQLADRLLMEFHVGQFLLATFVLVVLATLPLGSRKIVAANVTLFGLVFALVPSDLVPLWYLFLGLALLIAGPMLWVTAED